jgi:hypothetical protein
MYTYKTSEVSAVKRLKNVKVEIKKSNSGSTSICQYSPICFGETDKLINGYLNDG